MDDPKDRKPSLTVLGPNDRPDRRPWDQLEGETGKAWSAFLVYRDMGPGSRSLDASYVKAGGRGRKGKEKGSAAPGYWKRWAYRFQWTTRAAAWDAHVKAQDEAAMAKVAETEAQVWARRRKELREKEWDLARKLIEKAEAMLGFPLAQVTKSESKDGKVQTTVVEPVRWTIRDAARYLDVASKLARLAAELETDRPLVSGEVDVVDRRKQLREAFSRPDVLAAAETLARGLGTGTDGQSLVNEMADRFAMRDDELDDDATE